MGIMVMALAQQKCPEVARNRLQQPSANGQKRTEFTQRSYPTEPYGSVCCGVVWNTLWNGSIRCMRATMLVKSDMWTCGECHSLH
eukprot:c185_g1_i1 orf=421-675(+)